MDSCEEPNVLILEEPNIDATESNTDTNPTSISTVKGKSKLNRKRQKTSVVWTQFKELDEVFLDNKKRAECKYCGIQYICDSSYGTGNMQTHMTKCVRKHTADIGQLLMSQSQGSMTMRTLKFDPEKFRELAVSAILKHDLPFRFVEYDGVREMFKYAFDDIKMPSRNTAKAYMFKMYNREKENLKKLLALIPGRICLTSDLWTSISTDGYISLTAHYVDLDWKLQKKILNFCLMPPPHTGVALSEKIYTFLIEWGIEKKLFSLTLDNASSNDRFVQFLKNQLNLRNALLRNGEFFHVRCCAHILNLIVQDGLTEIDESVVKIRESIKYVKGSSGRKTKFMECVAQVSLDNKKGLRGDVPTRWNSTYLMLDNALFYRSAFIHLELTDSNYKHCPSQEEWHKIEKITNFLRVFYKVTCLFSGTSYPTANLYFPQVFIVQHTLKEALTDNDGFIRKMGSHMYAKFDKYWSEYSVILSIALILDPRYKLRFVDWAYTKLHGPHSYELTRVKDTLFELFDLYSEFVPHVAPSSSSTQGFIHAENVDHVLDDADLLFQDFEKREEEDSITTRITELQLYLDEKRLDRMKELDILSFWKGERFRHPILSQLARDVMTIPISTVSSESAFSIGGRVLNKYRSSLLPETVQALLCTRDWIFGKSLLDNSSDDSDVEGLEDNVQNMKTDKGKSVQCSNSLSILDDD